MLFLILRLSPKVLLLPSLWFKDPAYLGLQLKETVSADTVARLHAVFLSTTTFEFQHDTT